MKAASAAACEETSMTGSEAEALLRRRYPEWFRGAYLTIEDGWAEIVVKLFEDIRSALPAQADFGVIQIKEKMGGLRVYWNSDMAPATGVRTERRLNGQHVRISSDRPGAIQTLVQAAEERAAVTCQRCGRAGVMRNIDGYFAVLCDDDVFRLSL